MVNEEEVSGIMFEVEVVGLSAIGWMNHHQLIKELLTLIYLLQVLILSLLLFLIIFIQSCIDQPFLLLLLLLLPLLLLLLLPRLEPLDEGVNEVDAGKLN